MVRGSTVIRARLWIARLTANEAIIKVTGSAPRNGWKANRSLITATTTEKTMAMPRATNQGWSRNRYIAKAPARMISP